MYKIQQKKNRFLLILKFFSLIKKVQLKCLDTIRKIFTHKNKSISYSYIHSLAPDVISLINNEIESSLTTKLTRAKYRLITNGLEIVGLLVELAENTKSEFFIVLFFCLKYFAKAEKN